MMTRWQQFVCSEAGERAANYFIGGVLLGGMILFACGVIG